MWNALPHPCSASNQNKFKVLFPLLFFARLFSFKTNCKIVYESFPACKFFCLRNSKTNTQLGFLTFWLHLWNVSLSIIIRFTRKSHLEEKNSQYISLKTVVKLDPPLHCQVSFSTSTTHNLKTWKHTPCKGGAKNLKGKTIFQYKNINKGISFSL